MAILKKNTNEHYAVIFTAKMTANRDGYAEAVEFLRSKLEKYPGFLGMESVTDTEGNEITISYWRTMDDIKKWKADADHKKIRRENKHLWYTDFKVRTTKILYEYEMGTGQEAE